MRSDMEGEGGGSKRKDGKDGSKCQLQRPLSSGMESERLCQPEGRKRDREWLSKMAFVCYHVRFYSDLCHL